MENTPRLVSIAGPLQGGAFELNRAEITAGRDPGNGICIRDRWVSRHHFRISKEENQFKIHDLGSHNGTLVNGIPVKERDLEHGDRIEVAGSVFLFLVREAEAAPPPEVQFDDLRLARESTIQLRREEVPYFFSDKIVIAPALAKKMAADLKVLLKISTAVCSSLDLDAFQNELLERTLEMVPAQRGAILMAGERPDQFSSLVSRSRGPGAPEPVVVSRTIVQRVVGEKVGILSNHVLESDEFRQIESLVTPQIRSVLCLPLLAQERLVGLIYLDTRDPQARFEPYHLQLLLPLAGLVAGALEKARQVHRLEMDGRRLRTEAATEHPIIGESAAMRAVLDFIHRVGPTSSTILILGESGTGKELVARALHRASPRSHKPFAVVNCATLGESLLESELFGHEKGAFTGAVAQKPGKLELAHGGTVFLDEIAELPLPLQAKLLRALQEREFDRVGGNRPVRVDLRFIAATNRDLSQAVKEGRFREDLFYRVNVVPVSLPPLRERRDDIPLLARFFVARFSRKVKRPVVGLAGEAYELLLNYEWPGNVRELENAIERAVVLGSSELILPEDLPEALFEQEVSRVATPTYHDALREKKKDLIRKAMAEVRGSYTEAAKRLGVHPNYLHRLIRQLGLREELGKGQGSSLDRG